LATAYADLLEEQGEKDLAAEWFGAIAAADPDDLTGVSARFGDDDGDGDDEVAVDDEVAAAQEDVSGDAAPELDAAVVAGEVGEDELLDEEDPSAALGDEVPLDDIEAEVAELLGEAPPTRVALEFDHSRLFQEAPGQATPASEQDAEEQDGEEQDAREQNPGDGEQAPPTD
jgi:hypothetical protein